MRRGGGGGACASDSGLSQVALQGSRVSSCRLQTPVAGYVQGQCLVVQAYLPPFLLWAANRRLHQVQGPSKLKPRLAKLPVGTAQLSPLPSPPLQGGRTGVLLQWTGFGQRGAK